MTLTIENLCANIRISYRPSKTVLSLNLLSLSLFICSQASFLEFSRMTESFLLEIY